MIIDAGIEFSDAQSVVIASSSSTLTTVVSTNVKDMGTGMKDGWGSSKAPEIGGLTWNSRVNTALVGAGGIITASLVTKAADASISSGGTTLASLTFPATSAAGVHRAMKFPAGTTCLRYVGVIYSGAAAVSASAFDSFMSLDHEAFD